MIIITVAVVICEWEGTQFYYSEHLLEQFLRKVG